MSGGAKAGIAVGSIVGAALIFGLVFLAFSRKGRKEDAEGAGVEKQQQEILKKDTASIGSGETAH